MIKDKSTDKLKNIIKKIKDKSYNEALQLLKNLSDKDQNNNLVFKLYASIYFKKKDWENAIKYYKKILSFENDKFGIYNNIGVSLFNLGKINQSIKAFKQSITEKNNFDLAYDNLGISYKEIGMYDEAINNFTLALNLNKNNYRAKSNLISTLPVIKPKNKNLHPIIKSNYEIFKLSKKISINSQINSENIKNILVESENIISKINDDLKYFETQIFRKNTVNLNCNRHFKIFNEFKIIPKYCFNCYKIQVTLSNVVDLIKLFFVFDKIDLNNNNIRKCISEIRPNIKGNYKGYIYCDGLTETKKIFELINKIIKKLEFHKPVVNIKHGCSEFSEEYPEYEKFDLSGKNEMIYNKSWEEKENIVDKKIPTRNLEDKKIYSETLRGFNLSDILVIKNWINYAKIIGDLSYKKIYEKEVKPSFIDNLLSNQLEFRKKEHLN